MKYTAGPQRTSKSRWLYLLLAMALIAVAAVVGWQHHRAKPKLSSQSAKLQPAKMASNLPTSVQGKYLFSGTIMLGRAVETYANGDYSQPFSGLSTLGTYDARIGILECPITNNTVSYQTEVDKLIFNCKPGWIPTLKQYFPILNLSSDHMNDQGPDGISETFQRLQAAGVQTVGNFSPHVDKDNCQAVIMPVRLEQADKTETAASLPIALCSFNYKIIFSPQPGELESITKWSKIMPVIGLMNGGPEYEHQAGTDQVNVAHKMIDFGADFVVGNGTHWVQNTEVYKGKLIVYSMGNFIFDQLDYDGRIALNLSVGINLPYSANLSKWLQLGKSCQTVRTTCYDQAVAQNLAKLQPKYTFDAIGSYGGYQQVAHLANAQQQADIEQRANWQATQKALAADQPATASKH